MHWLCGYVGNHLVAEIQCELSEDNTKWILIPRMTGLGHCTCVLGQLHIYTSKKDGSLGTQEGEDAKERVVSVFKHIAESFPLPVK
jgi:hypothetical protein